MSARVHGGRRNGSLTSDVEEARATEDVTDLFVVVQVPTLLALACATYLLVKELADLGLVRIAEAGWCNVDLVALRMSILAAKYVCEHVHVRSCIHAPWQTS
jgi:hypothetical protein